MIKQYLSVFVCLLIWACATVQSPTGGEKDTIPPKLYESTPKHQSTEFKGKEIKLYFSEWMKVDNLKKELIITPREEIAYDFNLKKQELTITLEESLKDSTTYTFNFRKALKDITEENLWENPIIAFSTGTYLDSLIIQGTLKQIKNEKPSENYIVGLYDATYDTANLRQGKPIYFTTTDKEGTFKLQNLKKGVYRLFAFQDSNDNLINESKSEAFAIYPQIINLSDSFPNLNLYSYNRNEDTLAIKKTSPVGKDYIVQYTKGLKNYQITNPLDTNQHIYANNIEAGKYLRIYKENFPELAYETDSIKLFLQVTDSINTNRRDTIYFKIRESRITNDAISITNKPITDLLYGAQKWEFSTNKPIYQINYDSIQLRLETYPIYKFSEKDINLSNERKAITFNLSLTKDKLAAFTDSIQIIKDSIKLAQDTVKNQSDSSSIPDNKNDNLTKKNKDNNNVSLGDDQLSGTITKGQSTNQFGGSSRLNLYIGQGAFIGIEGDSTKQTTISFKFKREEDYGIIKGKVIGAKFNFIIELLNENYEVLDTVRNQNEFIFNYVKPGELRLRLIKDDNNNGVWDPGNPFLLKAEEQIFYKTEKITVKTNWVREDQNFDFTVDKQVDKAIDK